MTNRVEFQKIQEERAAPPFRPDWLKATERQEAPRQAALMTIIPLLGFALAVMLILSFANVLLGAPSSRLEVAPTHKIVKPARMAVFVL